MATSARLSSSARVLSQAFLILMFGVSLNGSDPPKAEQVLLNAAIQVAAECGQSLTCNLFFVVVKRQPAMSVPLLRMRGFSLVIIVMIAA